MKRNPSGFTGEDDLPAVNVSYNDITGFLAQLNDKLKDQLHGMKFALPTEEQWEFAARGGVKSKGYKYSGSNDIDQVAWYDNQINRRLHPVRKKAPNELGIYDMSGNVFEWCDSYWRSDYNTNPDSSRRVMRGGDWNNFAYTCRVAYRTYIAPDIRVAHIGFRLVLQ